MSFASLLCSKFIWYNESGSERKDVYILSVRFRYFVIISPLDRTLHLNKLDVKMKETRDQRKQWHKLNAFLNFSYIIHISEVLPFCKYKRINCLMYCRFKINQIHGNSMLFSFSLIWNYVSKTEDLKTFNLY